MQYLGRLNTQNYLIQNKKEILGKALKKNGLRQNFLPNYNYKKNVIMCAAGGFKLTKFISNRIEVLNAIPEEDRRTGVKV